MELFVIQIGCELGKEVDWESGELSGEGKVELRPELQLSSTRGRGSLVEDTAGADSEAARSPV